MTMHGISRNDHEGLIIQFRDGQIGLECAPAIEPLCVGNLLRRPIHIGCTNTVQELGSRIPMNEWGQKTGLYSQRYQAINRCTHFACIRTLDQKF
jgi:hypothetical protein